MATILDIMIIKNLYFFYFSLNIAFLGSSVISKQKI